ncbi:MAG: peptidoglycan DD-metalloendopeptidase family protein, partial [Gammaproteobacteria bacterium]|nr:M23 family metallopeptidase [Gemmatimonadota bacterium]NIU74026.1 peptidoglycan DD-metalloendopeptidase family protein [Gammaproteobacteria bacterium]
MPSGTPVSAMARGRVRFAGVQRGFGNVVWIDHGAGVTTGYAHLSEIRVREGQTVDAGDLVGLSGATGSVTAP